VVTNLVIGLPGYVLSTSLHPFEALDLFELMKVVRWFLSNSVLGE
jgi:hypothetical protein